MKSNLPVILSPFVPQMDETPQEWLDCLLHKHLPGLATQTNLRNLLGDVLSQVEFSSGFTEEKMEKLFTIKTYSPMNRKRILNENAEPTEVQEEHKHLNTIYDAVKILKNVSLNDFQKLLVNLAILENAERGLCKVFLNIKTLLQNNKTNPLALSELMLLRELVRESTTSSPSSTAFRNSLDRLYQAMTENSDVPSSGAWI
ncbi:uncharacterized protein LOC128882913 isoform X2 [Hylaeus volcanicus]|uniref:uncharacterized protein LOC128882913 isoform X2 n=1 Tax=Hylaeus volcanicus TaxID=313075 RepID=UPI0023B7DB36|nr:uncharacterized protein LOC128882913 isoform X2 [Hylaeus volcanicus]